MKELLYINGFPNGSYGNASANSVPEGFAVYTENTDPKFQDRLAPTRKSQEIAAATSLNAEVLKATNFDGVKVWGWEAATRELKPYDVATNAVGSALTTPSGQALQMIQNINRELYLPLYDNSTKQAQTTYWAGLIGHGQLNAAAPSGYQLTTAKCDPYYYAGVTRFPSAACLFNYVSATPANSRVSNSTTTDVFACITPPDETDFSGVDEDGFFQKGTTYYWAISFVYDGYQESPLLKYAIMTNGASSGPYWFAAGAGRGTSNYSSVKIRIWIDQGTTLSQRITGVNLYRAEAPGTLVGGRWDVNATGYQPATKYRFVQSFSIRTGSLSSQVAQSGGVASTQAGVLFPFNDNGASTSYHTYTHNSGNLYKIEFTDQGFEGATYEENTGVFDTLEQNWIDYRIGVFSNGYNFVARCNGAPTLLGARKDNVIFRSAPNAPAVFNIAKDFLQLPDTPTALTAWNGRLYAFSETRFMRINPESLFIEEEIVGFGAIGDETSVGTIGISRLVAPTPYGLFFADLNNIYMYDGQTIYPIGDPITRQSYDAAGDLGWVGNNAARRRQATMTFDPYSQRLLIFFKSHGADTQQYYLSYDPVRKRWDYGKPSNPGGTNVYTVGSVKAADFDSRGQLYVSCSTTDWGAAAELHTMFTGNDETITVVTPAYDFGSLKQTKWFYDVVVKNAGPAGSNVSINHRQEETAAWTAPASTTSGVLSSIDLNKTLGRILQLRLSITGAAGVGRNSIDDLSIQFRRKVMRE